MKTVNFEFLGKNRSRRAFSLIEVVLAVGIVSFALLSIMSMVPTGLVTVHNAQVLQATGNIADQIRGQVQLLSFLPASADSIQGLNGTVSYYDADGFLLPNATGSYYKATIATGNAVPTVNATFNSYNAQSVTVTIAYPPGALNQSTTFSFLVARQTDL